MAAKTGEHAYVGVASSEAEEETIDSMEIEVPSAKDVPHQTMPQKSWAQTSESSAGNG